MNAYKYDKGNAHIDVGSITSDSDRDLDVGDVVISSAGNVLLWLGDRAYVICTEGDGCMFDMNHRMTNWHKFSTCVLVIRVGDVNDD
jgi:hypothetical protein